MFVKITVYLYLWSNNNVVLYRLKLIKINSTLTFIVVLAYSKMIKQIFVTEYINRNWKIMIFKFISITQIDWKFQSLSIDGLRCFSKFYINTFRVFFYWIYCSCDRPFETLFILIFKIDKCLLCCLKTWKRNIRETSKGRILYGVKIQTQIWTKSPITSLSLKFLKTIR